jgi:hypothetical protein
MANSKESTHAMDHSSETLIVSIKRKPCAYRGQTTRANLAKGAKGVLTMRVAIPLLHLITFKKQMRNEQRAVLPKTS